MHIFYCTICTADEDASVHMIVRTVLIHKVQAFSTTAPLALQAKINIVSNVVANFAFAHVATHFTQILRQSDK